MKRRNILARATFTALISCALVLVPTAAHATEHPSPVYEVGYYVYKKIDPTKPAAWENSGEQTLITFAPGTDWLKSPELPDWVCGSGWAYQQDKVKHDGTFKFPEHITYPIDNIGWPPIYKAEHGDLAVPNCVTVLEIPNGPIASEPTCDVAGAVDWENVVSDSPYYTWNPAVGTQPLPGAYTFMVTAKEGYVFTGGVPSVSYSLNILPAAGNCPTVPPQSPPATTPPTPELAETGFSTGTGILLALAGLLMVALGVLAKRWARKERMR